MDVILNHTKTMNFQSFIFFLDTHPSGEATQKFSEFLELWLILYKNNKFGHYSLISGNSKIDLIFFPRVHSDTQSLTRGAQRSAQCPRR